jgi:hypothetical protein
MEVRKVLTTSTAFKKSAIDQLSYPPRTLYAPSLLAQAEAVQDLVDMQDSGTRAPFSQQFFRTRHLKSVDPRDKVFGLLGFSSFISGTIEVDYAKSAETIAAKATAMTMRDDLASFVSLQLW